MASLPDFRPTALLRELVHRGIDFVVIGGIAMIGHGSARLTRDLDIVYAVDPANLDALGEAMVGLGARLRGIDEDVPFVPDARSLRQMSIATLDTPLGGIDLLVSPSGSPAYAQLRARAKRITMDGITFPIASLDDLESMKRAAGRPKDLLDLEEIEVIRRLRRDRRRG
ncbi:MAG: nucleotidyltransferase [Conexibacteraceae bacterium]|nr:nucleotidyltransferase [Conexibacteraceae bacterium]